MSQQPNYSDKVFVITGAASGIGKELTLFLNKLGMTIIAIDINQSKLNELKEIITEKLIIINADITDENQLLSSRDLIYERYEKEGIDGIINNAGVISTIRPLEFVSKEDLTKLFDINVFAHQSITRKLLPLIRQKNGRIIFSSSLASNKTLPFNGGYSLTKFALKALASTLRQELSCFHIHVVEVELCVVKTQMTEKLLSQIRNIEETDDNLQKKLYHKNIRSGFSEMIEQLSRNIAIAPGTADIVQMIAQAVTDEIPLEVYSIGVDED